MIRYGDAALTQFYNHASPISISLTKILGTVKMNYVIAAAFLISLSTPALALDADDFSELEGYTVTAVTRVDGDFEGCEYDKKIKLQNGWVLSCQTYNYHYSYAPTVAVLTNDAGRGYLIKAIIDDEIYDMQPVAK